MATTRYNRLQNLTIEQQNAIDVLLTGASDAAVATRLGLHRVTVTRWRLYHPTFRAELDRRRRDLWGTATDSMRAALPEALTTMPYQLRVAPNRGRLALDFLVRSGVMGKPYSGARGSADIGPTTIEELVDEEVINQRAARAAADPTGSPITGPITAEERQAAIDHLNALADEASLEDSE